MNTFRGTREISRTEIFVYLIKNSNNTLNISRDTKKIYFCWRDRPFRLPDCRTMLRAYWVNLITMFSGVKSVDEDGIVTSTGANIMDGDESEELIFGEGRDEKKGKKKERGKFEFDFIFLWFNCERIKQKRARNHKVKKQFLTFVWHFLSERKRRKKLKEGEEFVEDKKNLRFAS